MGLTPEKLKEIQTLKAKQFLKPLLYNLNIEEKEVVSKLQKMSDIKDLKFTNSFILFSDVQVYRSVSIVGITRNFDRSIKYLTMSMSMLLDVWYSSYDATGIYTKDSLRTCDILILHGKNDVAYGTKKAAVLIDLLDERRSYGKITWLFIHGTDINAYNHYQPGVLSELKDDNIYGLKFKTEESMFSKLKDQIRDTTEIEMEQREVTVVDINEDRVTKEIPEMQITQTTVSAVDESNIELDNSTDIYEEGVLEDEHYTKPKETRNISENYRSYDDII